MPLPIPKFIKTAFANIGLRNNIPEITNNTTGAAGYDRGFGEINMLPEGAGGIPPDGKDFNGIFYELSSAIQYLQSGVEFPFDQTFANSIGGYSVGAVVSDLSKTSLWINSVDNNLLPPSSENGWSNFSLFSASESVKGVASIATQADVNLGQNDSKIIPPKKLLFGFSFVSNTNRGFIAFPSWLGGFIIQWGSVVTDSNGKATFTFLTAMPTKVLGLTSSYSDVSFAVNDRVYAQGVATTTNANGFVSTASGPGVPGAGVRFIVLGH